MAPFIAGLPIIETLNKGSRWVIHRVRTDDADGTAIVKSPKEEFPTPENLARLRIEHGMLTRLRLEEGVVDVYDLVKEKHGLALVLQDCHGESLAQTIARRRLPLREFLAVAIEISDILGRIHRHGIIHKDINPIISKEHWPTCRPNKLDE